MAYKEESDQQFIESVLRQVGGPRRPMANQRQYNGDPGHGPNDDSFGGYESSRINGGFQPNGPESQIDDIDDNDEAGNFIKSQQNDPRAEMNQIKKMIEAKEKELHELQQKKVELMRKITGRLESNNNLAFFKSWSEYQEGRDPNEPGSPEWIKAREEAHLAATKKRIPARLQSGINDYKKSKGDMLHRSVGQIAKMGNTSGG